MVILFFMTKKNLTINVLKTLSFEKNIFFKKLGLPVKPDCRGSRINSETVFHGFFPKIDWFFPKIEFCTSLYKKIHFLTYGHLTCFGALSIELTYGSPHRNARFVLKACACSVSRWCGFRLFAWASWGGPLPVDSCHHYFRQKQRA